MCIEWSPRALKDNAIIGRNTVNMALTVICTNNVGGGVVVVVR